MPNHGQNRAWRPGIETVTAALILGAAVAGLALLHGQVEVFTLGEQGLDARSFPRWVLVALAVASAVRLLTGLRRADTPIGAPLAWARAAAIALSMAIGLAVMPRFGFFVGALIVGVTTSFAFGERRWLLGVGIVVVLSAAVTFGARWLLGIPLP